MFQFLMLFAALVSLTIYARRLPAQNVGAIAVLILVSSALLEIVNARFGLPFGRMIFHRAAGFKVMDILPWTLPLIWLIALLNGRSTAELILRPWRSTSNYGFWLFGLGGALACFLLFNFQWHALEIRHDWTFPKGVKPTLMLNRFLIVPILFLLLVVWFIRKKPEEPKIDFYPLLLWSMLNSYFAFAAFLHRHVGMGSMVLVIATFAGWLAWKSCRKAGISSEANESARP